MKKRTPFLICLLMTALLVACGRAEEEPGTRATESAAAISATQTAQAPSSTPLPSTLTPTLTAPTVEPRPSETQTTEPAVTGETTATPTARPTDTLFPMCTPPLCQEGEVYYCPGSCPGGCGTGCATPTPTPLSPPVILSFDADRTTIVEGESVNLTWQASGGSEAYITWIAPNALLASPPGPLDPAGGTVTVSPTGDGEICLSVRNSAGSAEAHVQLTIQCAHAWVPALKGNPPSRNCPWEPEIGAAAQQPFEHGFMLWLEPSRSVYVFYDAGRLGSFPVFRVYPDNFHEGDPESDPAIVPPAGLYQPIRGFGLVWRSDPVVREGLGWATAPEAGFQTWRQGYQGAGMHTSYMLLQGIDGTIYHLEAFGGTWRIH